MIFQKRIGVVRTWLKIQGEEKDKNTIFCLMCRIYNQICTCGKGMKAGGALSAEMRRTGEKGGVSDLEYSREETMRKAH